MFGLGGQHLDGFAALGVAICQANGGDDLFFGVFLRLDQG
jgi:hypothetical protein